MRRRLAALLSILVLFAIAPGSLGQGRQTAGAKSATHEPPEEHLGKGYDALREDRYEVAAAEFRAALALDPKLTLRARFPLAVALFELHKPDEARREFEAVGREVGEHPNVSYYLGRLDLEGGSFESAIQNFSKAIANPPFPDTAYYLGYSYFKQGDLAAADKWLNEAARANPQDARMQYQLALVYRKEGREEEAKKALALSEQLRQKDADQSKLRLECAQRLNQGTREEAHAVCEQLYDPDNAEKLTALGTIYAQHGDLEAALKPLRRAAELAPQSPQMQYNLGLAYYQLHDFQQARAPLADAVKRWPDLFQLNALYGAVLFELGEDLLACQTLRHAHQINGEDSGTAELLYLATLRVAKKSQSERHDSEALRYFEEASKLRPREPAPHHGMAEIYARTGRPAQAAAQRREAERLAKNDGTPK